MSLYFFAIPALDPHRVQDELNRFCAGQRVVAVERQFVAAGLDSYWAVCVTVASGAGPLPDALKAPERRSAEGAERGTLSGRVDYWNERRLRHHNAPWVAVYAPRALHS